MSRFIDISGKTFNRLAVISRSENIGGQSAWLCQCDCGNKVIVRGAALRRNGTKSCGCLQSEMIHALNRKHGMYKSPEYKAWEAMKHRCNNPNNCGYKDYGGRGITYYKGWNSFPSFYKDMGERPSPKHSLDRINNNGNYEPSNCRWATMTEQNRNQRCGTLNKSGIIGVSRFNKKWRAYIGVNGKQIHIGMADDFFEACCLRKSAENRLWI